MPRVHKACEYALAEKPALQPPPCLFHFGCVPVDRLKQVREETWYIKSDVCQLEKEMARKLCIGTNGEIALK